MGIFDGIKSRYVIEMCKRQYNELLGFYEKLGFNSKQSKMLAGNCFGAKVVVRESEYYHDDWEFSRRDTQPRMPFRETRAMKAAMPMGLCSAPVEEALDDGIVFEEACVMPAPMPGAPVPEFNTAKTHAAPETESATPLDRPQMIFSANVNTASWSYIRNRVVQDRTIDKDFVRIEEIINSYPYKLKAPSGDELFSVNIEHGKCLWNDGAELLFVGLKGKKADKKVNQNLAFLVDVSGSMEYRWVLVQMSLMAIISKLGKGDVISIIAYSDETVTVVKQLKCDNIDDCIDAVLKIDGIGGCTNGSQGLENAYKYLEENYDKDTNNRVFIFTDGDFNFGITGEGGLAEYIKTKRKTGIYLSVVGYGMSNFKDDNMEALARNGNGNYTFVSNPADILENLWDKLISNLVTVAKDVKISIELNPQYVKEYRLIGYDARVLTQKEFNDTEKAVDGIGSEHNVAALIELKRGTAEKEYPTRYVNTETAGNTDEFAFIEIHYKTPEGKDSVMKHTVKISDLSETGNDNIPAASLLAAFGLYIKQSEYKGSTDIPMLRSMLDGFETKDNKESYSHFDIIEKYIENKT